MPRHALRRGSGAQMSRMRHKILNVRLSRERYALAAQKRAREKAAEAELDYDDPVLIEARQQLISTRINAEVARIQAEIAGHIRNGGLTPTDRQRAERVEIEAERRGWAMIEEVLRGQ